MWWNWMWSCERNWRWEKERKKRKEKWWIFYSGKRLLWKYDNRKLAQLSAKDFFESLSLLLETFVLDSPPLFAWDSERETQSLSGEEVHQVHHILSICISLLSHLIFKHPTAFSDVAGVSLLSKETPNGVSVMGIEGGGGEERPLPRRTKSLKLNKISKPHS